MKTMTTACGFALLSIGGFSHLFKMGKTSLGPPKDEQIEGNLRKRCTPAQLVAETRYLPHQFQSDLKLPLPMR